MPLNRAIIRSLVVLKVWQARNSFDPERLLTKFRNGREFDWTDLVQLVRRSAVIDPDRITADCARGFQFLTELTEDERAVAADPHQRERHRTEKLRQAIGG